MPLYDYRCTECGQEVEVMHGIHGSGPETCQACGGPMRKALSTPAIHFKGSGWAKKDAAAASAKKAKPKASSAASTSTSEKDGAGSKDESSGEGKASSGSDSKAESTSTPASSTTASDKSD